jgi:hypothetical protein
MRARATGPALSTPIAKSSPGELERELQRMVEEEDVFIAVGAASVMGYGKPR